MYCKNCGKEIPEGRVYCNECAPQEVYVEEQPVKQVDPSTGKGLAALICGIASFFMFGLVLAIVAMVLGGQAQGTAGEKMGKIGKILGIVSLILWIVSVVLLVIYYIFYIVVLVGVNTYY